MFEREREERASGVGLFRCGFGKSLGPWGLVKNFSRVVQWEGFPAYRKEKPICYKGWLWGFEGFSSIGILLVPFLRAVYFFFSRDVVQVETDRENITLLGWQRQQQEEEEEALFPCFFPTYILLLRSLVLHFSLLLLYESVGLSVPRWQFVQGDRFSYFDHR